MKNKKKSIKGDHPEDRYVNATVKNLYLDQPSSHGGWPEGEYDPPVNVQISQWMKSMGLMESNLRKYIRFLISNST